MHVFRTALLAMTFLAPVSFAVAQTTVPALKAPVSANPLADREDKIIPAVLLWMQQTGVRLTYLGNDGGLRAYLAESATGTMSTMYVTPDNLHVINGLLYGVNYAENGSNITGRQLDQMRQRYNSVADAVSKIDVNEHMAVADALKQIDVPKPEFDLPVATPSADNPAILNKLRADGYELTEIGSEGGLSGFFAKKSGIGQAIYVTPDGNHMLVGYMVQRGGKMVTGVQIGEMRARFDSAEAQASSLVSGSQAEKSSSENKPAPVPAPAADTTVENPVSTPANVSVAGPVSLPAPKGPIAGSEGNPSSMYYANLDESAFQQAVDTASWFDVGSSTAPVTLYMVADPNCPYCHATWEYIRPFITSQQVKVRIIMIAFLEGSDAKAREIMASPRPGIRFMESNAGTTMGPDRIDPNSKEYAAVTEHLNNNRKFTDKFGITGTPFLAYKDRQGQFYLSKGLPENLDAFFHAAEFKK